MMMTSRTSSLTLYFITRMSSRLSPKRKIKRKRLASNWKRSRKRKRRKNKEKKKKRRERS
jgi:hypothetical protein